MNIESSIIPRQTRRHKNVSLTLGVYDVPGLGVTLMLLGKVDGTDKWITIKGEQAKNVHLTDIKDADEDGETVDDFLRRSITVMNNRLAEFYKTFNVQGNNITPTDLEELSEPMKALSGMLSNVGIEETGLLYLADG